MKAITYRRVSTEKQAASMRLLMAGVVVALAIGACGGDAAAECFTVPASAVEGLLNSGPVDRAFAVRSTGTAPGGSPVWAVRIDSGSRSIVLLHDGDGTPGQAVWQNGLWASADAAAQSATGFPLNSAIGRPYPTDSVDDVRACT